MAINLVDQLKSLIPTFIIDGKDVSKTILVDVNENPVFLKGRAVLRTQEKKLDVYDENGALSQSLSLNDFDDSAILSAIAELNSTVSGHTSSIATLEEDVTGLGVEVSAAKVLAETNEEGLAAVKTTADSADSLSKANKTNLEALGSTVGSQEEAIANNTRDITSNTADISTKANTSDLNNLSDVVDTKADQSALNSVSTVANAADTLSKTNASAISTINSDITDIEDDLATTKGLANKASSDVNNLSVTVGDNSAQIVTNTKNIGDNATAIGTKANQSALDTVSSTATAADTLSKSNASAITGLSSAVDNNTAAIATKASQTELNTVKGTANAADSLSRSNEAKLAGKVSTDSDASVNSLHVKTGNYNSDDNFDLKVNGTNVLSATQSAIYAKKNIVFQGDNALIKGLANAVENKDAMNKQSVEALTNALGGRIDQIAAGAGDESDFITVDGFENLVTENGEDLLERLEELDGDTQCHIAFNTMRASRPAVNTSESRWVMYAFVDSSHPIWKFTPPDDVPLKDGLVTIEHTGDLGVSLRIVTESTILVKTMYYHFGTGNNGKRIDWQVWQPKRKGYEGFNKGQVLTDGDITWSVSSNVRTNMQRLRDAIPNGCTYIGWHSHTSSDNRYRIIAKGSSSDIEGTSGTFIIWRHGGTSSTAGIYINSAMSSAEGWARSYLGNANAWVTFGKQENRTTATRFEGVDKITIPFYEQPPELNLFAMASFNEDMLQLVAKDADGDYPSVGRYGVNWDGTWTRDEAYHTAFYRQESNTYIAFDYGSFKWRKFVAAKQHTFLGQQAVSSSISEFSERSQFPKEGSIYVEFGDLDTLPYEQITQPTIVHDNVAKTSTINFGAKRWGYIEGGGVPDNSGDYPEDGIDPIEEIEP